MKSASRRPSAVVERFEQWRQSAVVPRWRILLLLPTGGSALIGTLVAVNVVCGLLPVAFIVATSEVVARIPAALDAGQGSPAFWELVSAFLLAAGSFLGQQMMAPLQTALGERLRRRVDGRLREETARVVMQSTSIAPLEDHETLSAISEVTRLFDSGWSTAGMACSGMLALIARYVRLIGLLVIVGRVASWPSALGLFAATMLFRHGQRGGLRKYSAVWRQVAGLNRRAQYLRELATGPTAAKELRIFGLGSWIVRRYSEVFRAVNGPIAQRRREIYLRPYVFFTWVGFAVAVWVMVTLARNATTGGLSVAELALGVQAAIAALMLGEFYPEADTPTQFGMQAVSALDEVRRRVAQFQSSVGPPLPASSSPSRGASGSGGPERSVAFDQVAFRYAGAPRSVFESLSLELPAGKCTAIVGMNGAGKTTLVKLLTRLYEPTGGAIRVDGAALAELEPAAWRRQVSVIFQDFVRYELSAADNIALGAAHVPRDPAQIARSAEQAGILEAFSKLPHGLDTPLARAYRGGIDLSGGQWQRVAIARTLYALKAGARLLILDEPTSALDVRAEAEFFEQFVELTRGVTSVLISHRFSSVRRADRIIVIDRGEVIEQGSHQQLMAAQGHYAQLFRLQAERFDGLDEDQRRPAARAALESAAERVAS